MLRALVRFTAVQGVLVGLGCVLLQQLVFTDAASASAVRASAWLAFTVQILTFAIARLVSRENVIAGWGIGVILRFATVALWALLGVKALGLPLSPALLSLVCFYFVSTLVEPLFLNA
jgi:hypothetical protein